jgi:hypothetical protein
VFDVNQGPYLNDYNYDSCAQFNNDDDDDEVQVDQFAKKCLDFGNHIYIATMICKFCPSILFYIRHAYIYNAALCFLRVRLHHSLEHLSAVVDFSLQPY